jgi:hypothetical protein
MHMDVYVVKGFILLPNVKGLGTAYRNRAFDSKLRIAISVIISIREG